MQNFALLRWSVRTWTALSLVSICATAQDRGERGKPPRDKEARARESREEQRYSIEQATSDRAQLHTLAFDALAFLTGDVAKSSFLPPGKVADFFGFQYMRDIDAARKGHNPMFLDRIAGNVLGILDAEQRAEFERAARDQEELFREIGLKRLPLIAAFHRELAGQRPEGSSGLDRDAVRAHCADLFALDAELALRRARTYGAVEAKLTDAQKAAFAKLSFGNFGSWPEVEREAVRRFRPAGASKLVAVGYMTLASEYFSWRAGSLEADTYFCPERHGTYFGSFYLKDLPAMGQKDYDIPTSLTGDSGASFLAALTPEQRSAITGLVDAQRAALREIVEVRRAIASQLRTALKGRAPDAANVVALGRRYGELDGEIAWLYAQAFVQVARTLTAEQQATLVKLRALESDESGKSFLYAERTAAFELPSTDGFFARAPRAEPKSDAVREGHER